MALRRKRKKRKSRYHTGSHLSPKTGKECVYRSGWELLYFKHLDENPDVVTWSYEPVKIAYVGNVRTGKIRHYLPDILVECKDGTKQLVEIKPKKKLEQDKIIKKLAAGRQWCSEHGAVMVIVTEIELRLLGLMK
jgi:hypothetical protein